MKRIIIACTVFLSAMLWAISSRALTAQQVLELKKAGVSDQTIQMMIKQEENAQKTIETIGVQEVKDKDGNTIIIYSTGGNTVDDEEKQNVERAWEMLRNIIIDRRSKK